MSRPTDKYHNWSLKRNGCHLDCLIVVTTVEGFPIVPSVTAHVLMTSSKGNIFRVNGHSCGEFTGEFPAQRPVTRSFDVFFDLRLNKRLSKQWRGWWLETPSSPSRRHCNIRISQSRSLPSHYNVRKSMHNCTLHNDSHHRWYHTSTFTALPCSNAVRFATHSMVSCQKGPTRHAYAWQIGPFWQDTLELISSHLIISCQ